jgi:hypothetical protein
MERYQANTNLEMQEGITPTMSEKITKSRVFMIFF